MSTKSKQVCDMCGNETDRIVVRLFKARSGKRNTDYTHRAGIGTCCILTINAVTWHPRKRRPKEVEGA